MSDAGDSGEHGLPEPGPPGQGMPDLGALIGQIGEMQQQLAAAQEAAVSRVVEGTAGGGAVTVVGTGGLEVSVVRIDPSVVDAGEVDLLADLVLAAVRDYLEQVRSLQTEAIGGIGLGGGLGGLLGG